MKSLKSPDSVAGSSRLTMASTKDKDLQNQIEDLLMACTELQREQNLLTAQLQKEREDRQEDHAVFRSLVDYLKDNFTDDEEISPIEPETPLEEDPVRDLTATITKLVSRVEIRLLPSNRRSSGYETKASLRASMAALREQLQNESSRSQDLARQVHEKEEETARMKDELQKARIRIQSGHTEKQRLEKTVYDLRQAQRTGRSRAGSQTGSQTSPDISGPPSRSDTGSSDASTNSTGLREFRLMQSLSNRSSNLAASPQPTYSKRVSSLSTQAVLATADHAPLDQDALLLELVNAKTAEAVAKQELEELKARFEAMRKMLNVSPPVPQLPSEPLSIVSSRSSETTGTPKSSTPIQVTKSPDSAGSSATSAPGSWGAAAGGFFGWGKRSLSSAQVPTIKK
jgi:predicted transcriptional regulator